MSAISTPNRSRASSASSSPASRVAKSPMELTPRSKVKAMLAAAGMSDDSEDDDIPTKPANAAHKKSTADAPAKPASPNAASSEDDDEDVVPVRKPAGKMAARMMARRQEPSEGEEEEEEDNSYARVKRMLMSGKDKQKEAASSPPKDSLDEASSSEEDAVVSKPAARRRGAHSPVSRSRASSPGLFVSPARPYAAEPDSDAENPSTTAKSKLDELVARKRAERKEREAASKTAREANRRKSKANQRAERELAGSETDSNDDEEVGKKLTQQSRPTRKASKKAIEEMNRETQRMSRMMQLTHRAKTKKKYTTKDLFAKFNYGQPKPAAEDTPPSNDTPNTSSDLDQREKETPPTSPQSLEGTQGKDPTQNMEIDDNGFRLDTVVDIGQNAGDEEDLPDLGKLLAQSKRIAKGKGRAMSEKPPEAGSTTKTTEEQPLPEPNVVVPRKEQNPKVFRVVPPKNPVQPADDEDDDDLEIVHSRFPVFDNLPLRNAKEPPAFLALRHLAHLNYDDNVDRKGRRSLTAGELQAMLKAKAREQAKQEKEEKIEQLRAKGIFVQTEEERERDQLELENLLEKARKEDEELAKKEKAEKKAEGGGDDLPDSDDDESYVEDGEGGDEEEPDLEMSGSEDEIEEEEEEAADAGGLLDNEAGEDEDEEMAEDEAPVEAEVDAMDEGSDEEDYARRTSAPRGRRRVVDDDDEEETGPQPSAPQSQPPSTQDEAMAAFGFAPALPPVGLSQMFAGTMADPESQAPPIAAVDSQQDSLDFLRNMPVSTIPGFDMGMTQASQQSIIRDSQPPPSQTEGESGQIELGLSQFPSQPVDGGQMPSTQMSDMPDPTQDGGFDVSRTPGRYAHRTPAPSSAGANGSGATIDTVILPGEESPALQKKKGRLQRGKQATVELSDVDQDDHMSDADDKSAVSESEVEDTNGDFNIDRSAFDVLRKGAKKAKKRAEAFDKKNSAAKDMVYEQAEESEDEYAGLGGVSDDDSNDELDEDLKQMVVEGKVDVNERELAAFAAERERAEDEKRIDKLYKDITNGGLRKRRGGNFDLSDSDDDGDEMRRRKQREFARMRKALMEDERIGKIAENPKKQAFLRAIEDHDDDDDIDILDGPGDDSQTPVIPDSQEDTANVEQQNTAPAEAGPSNPLKRKSPSAQDSEDQRPPARLRRTAATTSMPPPLRKPTTLAEIRESVSSLIDDPSVQETDVSDSDSDAGDDEPSKTTAAPTNGGSDAGSMASRRTVRPIVDRLSLSRSSTAATSDTSQPLAFHAPASSTHRPGFRVPTLLRRATTNLSTTSTTSDASSGSGSAAAAASAEVRRGGNKKSSIHYQSREAERKKVVEAAERKRKEGLRKRVGVGRKSGLAGYLGAGSGGFE
ncbi:MRC1-like domain-containing protein [Phyllosticta citribraziliensis]|uniref:MRC1-like domain-containing protein n=1 Tax=Phyllosticta citribraziliensis TaxID=989973 RepID=A0ABR1M3E5_9PEZI